MTKYFSNPSTPVRDRSPHSITIAASNCPCTVGDTWMSRMPGKRLKLRRRRILVDELHVLAQLPQRVRHGELRADGIAVGPGVRGDDEALPLENGIADLGNPVSGHQCPGRRVCPAGVACVVGDFLQQLLDAILVPDALVELEVNLRRPSETEPLADLAPHEARGAFERARGVLACGLIAEAGVVDAGMLQVGRHVHARHGHEADAGIVQLARDHRRDLRANLIGDALRSGTLAHMSRQLLSLSVVRRRSSVADI